MQTKPLTAGQRIKQTRPFPSPQAEATVTLLLTSDVVRRFLSQQVEPHGITLQQYNVLRILRGAGEAGLPTLEIVERMIEQTPGITRLLDRLEERRWVQRERCPTDRRQVTCRISPAGLALLTKLEQHVAEIDHRVFAALSEAELTRLVNALNRVRAELE